MINAIKKLLTAIEGNTISRELYKDEYYEVVALVNIADEIEELKKLLPQEIVGSDEEVEEGIESEESKNSRRFY